MKVCNMSNNHTPIADRIPALRPIYAGLHDIAETLMRVVCGGILAVHGYPKILNPFGATEMVEGLGFYPGSFWSPALSITEFVVGIMLMIGLFTRPAAVAASVILAVTVYAHWVAFGQGYAGSEKSILWLAMTLFFAVRGSNRQSVDAALGRQF
ncbi:DoxX family protein [Xinfangfangia sp. CPCC 101601]|uniref:DoxX family protein n=1 Tax=Pseudogemmobacter lacusdianii TaxID=3069608 RepID=A0ABU0VXB3_9RHOB|nr:DoxX family protein [Xinfangfangia sp. CPCC 101601]MDQ2065830.1 DoxX family protein [Xinfangfangia sp. CPCC 101601]